jgi:hypothetical protein
MDMSPDGAQNEEWMCRRKPAANYSSAQDSRESGVGTRSPCLAVSTGTIEISTVKAATKQRLVKADWEDLVYAIMLCTVCTLMGVL